MQSELIVLSMIVTAIATIFIAIYACLSYRLANAVKLRSDAFEQNVRDLYEAIVIATLISAGPTTGEYSRGRSIFEEQYKGKTPIFKNK